MPARVKLTRVNNLLLTAILVVNSYTILLPLLPRILFWNDQHNTSKIQKMEAAIARPTKVSARPQDNRLIIPSMVFDEAVHEGKSPKTLRQGLWRRPLSSTPNQGGNTVLVGHRLTYTNPRGTLYNLDKVHTGDPIGLWWSGKLYRYKVIEVKVVGPNQTSVESQTNDNRLTIYTCTPLWLPKERLVVIARLEDTP